MEHDVVEIGQDNKIKRIKLALGVLAIVVVLAMGVFCAMALPTIVVAVEKAEECIAEMDSDLFKPLHRTTIYDKDGKVISRIGANNYEYVEIKDVSKYVYDGYIAAEDRKFKTHNGIDYKAIARAGVALVKNKGTITQGGSTITQQVIKNNMLSQERTYTRKIAELIIAPELEERASKDEIMEFYVNTNFYGNNCNGIQSASRYYFGKNAKDLSLSEAATLVGITNNPSAFNPVKNPKASLEKRDRVLKQMLQLEFISESQYREATKEKVELTLEKQNRTPENYMVSYALYSLALELMEQDGFEYKYLFKNKAEYDSYKASYSEMYGSAMDRIRKGGYSIYTAFDLELQEELQKSIDDGLKGNNSKQENGKFEMQGSAVCIDNETGYVVAIVGGRGTEDEYNRAFLSSRQPGSTAKPVVVYAPAFETGEYYPSLKIRDEHIEGGPSNYSQSFVGTISLREALGRSTNTIAYKVYADIGVPESLKYLEKLKISSLSHLDSDNYSLGLGGFTYGVKPVEWARAYSTLANSGKYVDKSCIKKVVHEKSGEIYNGKNEETYEVFTDDIAYIVTDCLKGVINEWYGSGRGLKIYGVTAAGKTGTTNDKKDGWFTGYTKKYTTVVWVGNDQPKRVAGLVGSSYPGWIWKTFMTKAHSGIEDVDWEKPDTVEVRHVNWSGEQVKYRSSYTDLFSVTVENRKSAERERVAKEKAEREQREKDEKAYELAVSDLDNLSKFEVNNVEDVEKLEKVYEKARISVESVRDDYDNKQLLKNKLSLLKEKTDETVADWSVRVAEYKAEKIRIADAENKIAKAWDSIQVLKNHISVTDSMYSDINKAASAVDEVGKIQNYDRAKTEYERLSMNLLREKERLLR